LTGETAVLGEKPVTVLVYGTQNPPSAILSTRDTCQYYFASHISHVNGPGIESRLTTSSVSHDKALENYVCARNF
jgi:hypothetical protein